MIPAIVLAAGASSRMGRPKALLPIGPAGKEGETFLSRITRILQEAGVEEIIVVLGNDAAAVRAAMSGSSLGVRLIDNAHSDQGQLSSLLVGLRAADRPAVRAVLVTLVDVPLVSVDTVRTVLSTYKESKGALIVRPAREGQHGHPTIFDRALFQELRQADPAVGARAVVHAHQAEVVDVAVPDEGSFIDIDTPEAYARLIGGTGL
jgi:molybdenum cofactor cytidylyltransferase